MNTMKQKFTIKGMTCGGCRGTVQNALSQVDGVASVQVNLNPPEAIIKTTKHVSLEQLQASLSKTGHYSIVQEESSDQHHQSHGGGGGCCG